LREASRQAIGSLACARASASSSFRTESFGVLGGAAGVGAAIPEVWGAFWPDPCVAGCWGDFGLSTAGPLCPAICCAEPPSAAGLGGTA
jgi:hypothetical protein